MYLFTKVLLVQDMEFFCQLGKMMTLLWAIWVGLGVFEGSYGEFVCVCV